jgi:hypothetical protein
MEKMNTAQERPSSIRGLVTWIRAALICAGAAPPRDIRARSAQQKHAVIKMPAGTLIIRSGR